MSAAAGLNPVVLPKEERKFRSITASNWAHPSLCYQLHFSRKKQRECCRMWGCWTELCTDIKCLTFYQTCLKMLQRWLTFFFLLSSSFYNLKTSLRDTYLLSFLKQRFSSSFIIYLWFGCPLSLHQLLRLKMCPNVTEMGADVPSLHRCLLGCVSWTANQKSHSSCS